MKIFWSLLVWISFTAIGWTEPVQVAVPDSDEPALDTTRVEEIARFTIALEQIYQRYVATGKEITYEELINGAIDGMMSTLDPYSERLENRDLTTFRESTRGAFGGIGVVINEIGPWVTVVSPIEGSPGWDAGLLPGDRIVEIEQTSARGLGVQGAVQQLRGTPGTDVQVTLYRPSEDRSFSLTLTREIIETPSVEPHRILEEGVGYLRVRLFAEDTADRMRKELTAMRREGVTGLVLDLRGNPGGLLDAAVEVSGLFLPEDSLVVYTMGREDGSRQEYRTQLRPHRLNPELMILVNGGSASASEIVSGALQDAGRARLVGTTTFGKASVQSLVPMPDGSALKLTTATYYTPSGREIHERGIDPDEEVFFPMGRWLRGRSEDASDWTSDPQISRAVEMLRGEVEAP